MRFRSLRWVQPGDAAIEWFESLVVLILSDSLILLTSDEVSWKAPDIRRIFTRVDQQPTTLKNVSTQEDDIFQESNSSLFFSSNDIVDDHRRQALANLYTLVQPHRWRTAIMIFPWFKQIHSQPEQKISIMVYSDTFDVGLCFVQGFTAFLSIGESSAKA